MNALNSDCISSCQGKSSYSFSYGVSDGRTGDIKTVWESRDGDTVKGILKIKLNLSSSCSFYDWTKMTGRDCLIARSPPLYNKCKKFSINKKKCAENEY